MELQVIKHTKERNRSFYNHTAIISTHVDVTKYHDEVVVHTSIKCGYHPAGYGLYGQSTIKPTENPNEYVVKWCTASSCD